MSDALLILVVAFVTAAATTPVMQLIAVRADVMDRPSSALKVHRKPIPYLGGVAILLGLLVSLAIGYQRRAFHGPLPWVFAAGAAFICVLGLLDDLYDIRQTRKFWLQLAFAAALVAAGYRITTFPSPFIAIPLTMLCVVGACNALNLLDGLDGLAAGNSAIAAFFFLVLFLASGNAFGAALAASLLGACAGFLPYNFNPASIFMGDAGSMLLGFALSSLIVQSSGTSRDLGPLLAGILVCGVPVFDTSLAYLRRYLNGRPIFPGDRSHFYDQLVDRGLTVKQTVAVAYALGVAFGIAALVLALLPGMAALLLFAAVVAVLAAIAWRLRLLEMKG